MEGIVHGDIDQHVIRQDVGIKELEHAVFGGFHSGDIARQVGGHGAPVTTRFTENQPVVTVAGALVLVTLRFDPFQHPLVQSRVAAANFFGGKSEQVDDHHAARFVGQVATIAVGADMLCHAFIAPESERKGFFVRDDKARAEKHHAST